MEITLPDDLQRYVHDLVRLGRFPSEQQVVREALEHFKHTQQTNSDSQAIDDPWLGSMHEDAALLEEIVEEAMVIREERPWRLGQDE